MRNLQSPPLPLKNFSPSRVLPRLRGPDPDLVSSGLPAACTKQECSLFLLPKLLAGRCHSSAPGNPEVWRSGAGRVRVSKLGWGLGRARVLKADTVQHSYLPSPDQLPSCGSPPIPPPLCLSGGVQDQKGRCRGLYPTHSRSFPRLKATGGTGRVGAGEGTKVQLGEFGGSLDQKISGTRVLMGWFSGWKISRLGDGHGGD